jgi:hypothetical protein
MKFKKPLKITSRTSSITNSFVQAIIPSMHPTPEEKRNALAVLNIDPEKISCVYCGSNASDWDHLRPLVHKKRPSGYINNIRNAVPSCGPCNQSKGGAEWRKWIKGSAQRSPTARAIADLPARMERLEQFERWANAKPIKLEQLAGAKLWAKYWSKHDEIVRAMHEAQKLALEVGSAIQKAIDSRPPISSEPEVLSRSAP